jgi:hypothetical protein
MEKARKEIVSITKTDGIIKIIKLEKGNSYYNARNWFFITVVIAFSGLVAFEMKEVYKTVIITICSILIAIGFIVLLLVKVKIEMTIDVKNKKVYLSYWILFIRFSKKELALIDLDSIAIVRFNISSILMEGLSFRRLLNLYHKYAIYVLYENDSYERLIDFNNYSETREIANILKSGLDFTLRDTTEEEFKDEDQFISSHIRYKEMIKEVRSEK